MERKIFEAFEGQQDMFGYSQAVRVGDTTTSPEPSASAKGW